jgi:outer membrane protein assembly factor BamB
MRKTKFLILIFGILVLCFCQKKKPTEIPLDNNIFPQEHIAWPSLADSPWPINHHDPQSTGRSQYKGPRQGKIKWKFKPEGYIHEPIIIGIDSAIYFVSIYEDRDDTQKSSLYAINSDGTLKWRFLLEVGSMDSSPIVSADGTIYLYVPEIEPAIYAINPDGSLKEKILPNTGKMGDISIGIDHNIYFLSGDKELYAMSQQGEVLFNIPDTIGLTSYRPAFSPNGNFAYVYRYQPEPTLCSVDLNNLTLNWYYPFSNSSCYRSPPMIDCEGNMYVGIHCSVKDDKFYSISPTGKLNWSFDAPYCNEINGTIDPNGNIYFVCNGTTDRLISLDYNGNLRWEREINDRYSSLICDREGVVYFFQPDVTAISPDGNILWQVQLDGSVIGRIASPAIGYDEILYVGTYSSDSKLYAIE